MNEIARMHVLLVEDNATDALIVQDDLEHAAGSQFTVVHLETLHEALTRLKIQRFDVVLLDLSLPDSHGSETFERVRHLAPETPLIVLSGRADQELAIQAVQAGAQDYLVKGQVGEGGLQRSIRYAIERQRGERTLAESEERYRLLIERSPDGYMVKCAGQIVFANATALRLFGAERKEQLVGRTFLDLVAPEFHAVVEQRIRTVVAGRGNRPTKIVGLRLDGTTVALEGTSNAFQHEGLPAVQIVLRDITERQRAAKRFDWLVNSNAQGVMFWNTGGGISGSNDAFLSLIGYSREDLEAGLINWVDLTPPEHAAADRRAMEEIQLKGFCAPYEKEFTRQDGSRVSTLIGASAFPDKPEEGVCFTLDLTERNKMQQHSLRTQRMESIGTLAGGIAHDLNNSLGPIITALDLLKMKFPDPDSQELLSIVSASAMRGADMVRQVLSFARGVEGRRMEVQVKHLLHEVEKIATDTFPKNILLRTIFPPDLWTVVGDPTQLHQVLLNLCLNARDAMPAGGALTLSAQNLKLDEHYIGLSWDHEAKPGLYVALQISDSGTGMPSEVIEKIFDPFYTTKELGKGTGLGLSTTLAILKSHGGFIRVYSEVGKGTKFKVYLPALPESCADAVVEKEPEMPRGLGELILVVEDEEGVREITQRTLEAFGYRVLVAFDGAEAVALYAERGAEIAAVLTDMMMPLMDGPATIEALRRLNPDVRIVGASGLPTNGPVAHAASLDLCLLLAKPYTAESLLKALKQILSSEP